MKKLKKENPPATRESLAVSGASRTPARQLAATAGRGRAGSKGPIVAVCLPASLIAPTPPPPGGNAADSAARSTRLKPLVSTTYITCQQTAPGPGIRGAVRKQENPAARPRETNRDKPRQSFPAIGPFVVAEKELRSRFVQ